MILIYKLGAFLLIREVCVCVLFSLFSLYCQLISFLKLYTVLTLWDEIKPFSTNRLPDQLLITSNSRYDWVIIGLGPL